jgi:hypothetical protein
MERVTGILRTAAHAMGVVLNKLGRALVSDTVFINSGCDSGCGGPTQNRNREMPAAHYCGSTVAGI